MSGNCVIAKTLYKPGTGRVVGGHDRVRLQYSAASSQAELMHGPFIENTFDTGKTLTSEIGDKLMLPGVGEALVGTRVGSTWRLTIDLASAFAGGAAPVIVRSSTVMLEIFLVDAEEVDPTTTFAAWFSRIALPVPSVAASSVNVASEQESSETESVESDVMVVRSALSEMKAHIETNIRSRHEGATPTMREQLALWRGRSTSLSMLEREVDKALQRRNRSELAVVVSKIDTLGAECLKTWQSVKERLEERKRAF